MYQDAKKFWDQWIKDNFDLEDKKIDHKLRHTYQVVENMKWIADSLKLTEKEKELAKIIALLHDIGRFDQAKICKSFREDQVDYNHATFGIKILFEKGLIRSFIKEDQYDTIIIKAIENHGKYLLDETDMTKEEVMYAKMIRDADKLDSFRMKISEDINVMANITEEEIENSFITEEVYQEFMKEKTILSKKRKTAIDIWISYIAFVFGIYYPCSLEKIKKENYINQLVDRFSYTEKETKEKMEEIRKKAIDYLEEKIEKGI